MSIEKKRGLFLLRNVKNEGQNTFTFQRKHLDKINANPVVSRVFAPDNLNSKDPHDLVFSTNKRGTAQHNKTTLLTHTEVEPTFQLTIASSHVKKGIPLSAENHAHFIIKSNGETTTTNSDFDDDTELGPCLNKYYQPISDTWNCPVLKNDINQFDDFLGFDLLPTPRDYYVQYYKNGSCGGWILANLWFASGFLFLGLIATSPYFLYRYFTRRSDEEDLIIEGAPPRAPQNKSTQTQLQKTLERQLRDAPLCELDAQSMEFTAGRINGILLAGSQTGTEGVVLAKKNIVI